jgi:hypothetical protein
MKCVAILKHTLIVYTMYIVADVTKIMCVEGKNYYIRIPEYILLPVHSIGLLYVVFNY